MSTLRHATRVEIEHVRKEHHSAFLDSPTAHQKPDYCLLVILLYHGYIAALWGWLCIYIWWCQTHKQNGVHTICENAKVQVKSTEHRLLVLLLRSQTAPLVVAVLTIPIFLS